jgi:hypothetical protein
LAVKQDGWCAIAEDEKQGASPVLKPNIFYVQQPVALYNAFRSQPVNTMFRTFMDNETGLELVEYSSAAALITPTSATPTLTGSPRWWA